METKSKAHIVHITPIYFMITITKKKKNLKFIGNFETMYK